MPRAITVAGPVALVATLSVVSLGVLTTTPQTGDLVVIDSAPTSVGAARSAPVTRSDSRRDVLTRAQIKSRAQAEAKAEAQAREKAAAKARKAAVAKELDQTMAPAAVKAAVDQADDEQWSTTELNLWASPAEDAEQVGTLDEAEKVLATGRTLFGRDEIVVDGVARWVTDGYLDTDKPEPAEASLGGACTNGTTVASGVSPNIVKVHEAVCAAFPDISTYGTFRGDGEHSQGLAVDIMVSGSEGQQVAEFVRSNYAALGVNYVIYSQNIWSVQRSGEGWRGMSDRGSITANHYDHVHVTVY